MKKLFICALLCVVACAQAGVIISPPNCADWVNEKEYRRNAYEWYLAGYLSGMNRDKPEAVDPLRTGKTFPQYIRWIDNYCQANPLNYVTQGAEALYEELGQMSGFRKDATNPRTEIQKKK